MSFPFGVEAVAQRLRLIDTNRPVERG